MCASLNFNAQQYEPTQAFTPIPEGWYPVMITESEMKPVKPPKQGAYLNLTLTVQGGEHNNRKLFARLNLHNENPVAVEIAQRELSAICHVTGVMQLQDSQQLHGIPFQAKVTVRGAEGNYSATNEIKGYRDINGNDPGKAGQPQAGGQAPAQPAAPQAPQAPAQPAPPAQPHAPQQPQAPQGGGWQQPAPQQPAQQPPQGGQPWQQGGQPAPQQAPQNPAPQAPQQAPQAQPDQGYTQPPQGGEATPVAPPQQGDQSGVPPWQRQQ